jgi:hypothetical protein
MRIGPLPADSVEDVRLIPPVNLVASRNATLMLRCFDQLDPLALGGYLYCAAFVEIGGGIFLPAIASNVGDAAESKKSLKTTARTFGLDNSQIRWRLRMILWV